MELGLIISILANIFMGFLLLLIILLIITRNNKPIIIQPRNQNCGGPVCPIPPPDNNIQISTEAVYTIRTLNGLFLKGCFGCLDSPVACIEKGIVAAPDYVEDKFKFIKTGNNTYQILYIPWEGGSVLPKLYLIMVRKKEQYQLCLTENPNQTAAQFEIVPYYTQSRNGVNLYQIGSVISGSLIGEGEPSCLVKEGIPIVDGYNLSPNAPKGMDERSLFLIIPA